MTEWVLRHRRSIVIGWLVLALVGGWAAATLSGHLSQRFDAPGRPAFAANQAILHDFHSGGVISPIVLVARRGDTVALRRIAAAVPGARAVIGGSALRDRRSTIALVFPPPGRTTPDENDTALAMARQAARGTGVGVTGEQALSAGGSSGGASLLVETVLGGAGALVVLVLVFGSAIAVLPIMLAAVSILTTFLVLRGLAGAFTISFVVQFLVGLIGLGVAIDYSLLMIVRWREERAAGADPEQAVRRAMATAGHAVLVSGTTVGIGLIALVAVPVPFIRSIGVGGLLIPVISVAANLTLLPVVLAGVGPRLDRRGARRRTAPGRGWRRWSTLVVRRRWIAAGVGLAIMAVLAVQAISLNPGQPALSSLAASGPARAALVRLRQGGLGAGILTPIEVVAPAGAETDTRRSLRAIAGVHAVLAPAGADWQRHGRRLLEVLPRADSATPTGRATLDAVRARSSATLLVGGVDAQDSDLTNAIYGAFPLMAALIAVLTFVLLAFALRSLLLPLKAIALNVLSIAAAFGVVVLI